ncbi:hypothetical protein JB92DRAFT_2831002 [Gautieria morchelliformis]|nr:hypothetical protein JB92DRAFT_2831002 [Gautieria morchelliformis]
MATQGLASHKHQSSNWGMMVSKGKRAKLEWLNTPVRPRGAVCSPSHGPESDSSGGAKPEAELTRNSMCMKSKSKSWRDHIGLIHASCVSSQERGWISEKACQTYMPSKAPSQEMLAH